MLLTICFSGLLAHGILPDSMLPVLLVPVIKEKTCKVSSLENYRPIALASILSKVLQQIIFDRLQQHKKNTNNQFGFKKKRGTDLCIYALKELVFKYNSLGSTIIFVSLMDPKLLTVLIMVNCL